MDTIFVYSGPGAGARSLESLVSAFKRLTALKVKYNIVGMYEYKLLVLSYVLYNIIKLFK